MDADVYGPNVPIMLGASDARPEVDGNKLVPIEAFGVKFMSMALLQPGDKPMIVRGPILHGLVKQFLSDVKWGELDYLIVDMPPGPATCSCRWPSSCRCRVRCWLRLRRTLRLPMYGARADV